tara:strand:- start:5247 stop:5849 length:603 start_codon:yes stop_codon:yes gene_type:complete
MNVPAEVITLAASVVTAIATLGSVWLGRRIAAKRDGNCIVKETLQNTNVYTALNYLIEETGADRAYVMEFHNGEHYFSGRGQQKFSCTYEVVGHGISTESEKSQNHRVSNYHLYIKQIVESGYYGYADASEIEDRGFLQMIRQKGISAIYNVPIKTLNGKIIGILGVDYVKSPVPENDERHNQADFLKRQARVLGGYLVR